MDGDGMGLFDNQHLIHSFIHAFTKPQLENLKDRIEANEPVDLAAFCACVHRSVPGFFLPVVRNTRLQPQESTPQARSPHDQAVQHDVLRELFQQLDAAQTGSICWSDVTALLVEKSDTGSKQLNLYSDIPVEPRFVVRQREIAKHATAALSVGRAATSITGEPVSDATADAPQIGSGKGLHWDQIECLKYFPALHLYCLSGKGLTATFTLDVETGKAHLQDVLKGPTAAVFNMYHLPTFQRVVVMCADRYLYFYSDAFAAPTPSQKIKVANPQLSAVVVRDQQLCTGGTDGVVLVFTMASVNKPFVLTQQFSCGTEYICDLLYISELDQLLTASADGLVTAWDISWDDEMGYSSFKVRSKTKTHHASVKMQVSYNAKFRLVFTIGHGGHALLCWNSFICSQSHLLKGHDKPITKIHAFETWPEVISADMSGKVIVWDTRLLVAVQCFGGAESVSPIGPLTTFTYNADNDAIVTVGDRFCVFPSQLERKGSLNFRQPILGVLHSSRRGLVVTYTRERVLVWNAHTGHLEKEYTCFEESYVTCATLVNDGGDLAVGSAKGEIHFVSLLSKVWFEKAMCGEGVVTMHAVDRHTPASYIMYTGAKAGKSMSWYTSFATGGGHYRYPYEASKAVGTEVRLLFVVTASGEVQMLEYGTAKCGCKPLQRWQITLSQLANTVMNRDVTLLAAYGEKELEIWEPVLQKLCHSMRCRSAVQCVEFTDSLEALVVIEDAGFLHVYSCPGYAYLLRFRFSHATLVDGPLSPKAYRPISCAYLYETNELVCIFDGVVKVVNMDELVSRQRSHAHRFVCGEAERLLNGRYVEIARDSVRVGVYATAYDSNAHKRVLLCATSSRSRLARETEMLQRLAGRATMRWLEQFSFTDEPEGMEPRTVHVNVVQAPEVTFKEFMLTRRCASDARAVDVFAIAHGVADALAACHEANIVVFLTPSKIAFSQGRWVVADLLSAVDGGARINPTSLPWVDTPPEVAPFKKRYEFVALDAASVGELGFEARPGVDIWGLGSVLWTVLRGVGVFEGLETAQIPEKLLQFDISKLRHTAATPPAARGGGNPACSSPSPRGRGGGDPMGSPRAALERARLGTEGSGAATSEARVNIVDSLLDGMLVHASRRYSIDKVLECLTDRVCLPDPVPEPVLFRPFPRDGPLVAKGRPGQVALLGTLSVVESDVDTSSVPVQASPLSPGLFCSADEEPVSELLSVDIDPPRKYSFGGANRGPRNPQRKPSLSMSLMNNAARRESSVAVPPSPASTSVTHTSPRGTPRRRDRPTALDSPSSMRRSPSPRSSEVMSPTSMRSMRISGGRPPAPGGSPRRLASWGGNRALKRQAQSASFSGPICRLLPSRVRARLMRSIEEAAPVACRTMKPCVRERFTAAYVSAHLLDAADDGPVLFTCEHTEVPGGEGMGRAAVSCHMLDLVGREGHTAMLGALPLRATVSCMGFAPEMAAAPQATAKAHTLSVATRPVPMETKEEWGLLEAVVSRVLDGAGAAVLVASQEYLPPDYLVQRGIEQLNHPPKSPPGLVRQVETVTNTGTVNALRFLQRQVLSTTQASGDQATLKSTLLDPLDLSLRQRKSISAAPPSENARKYSVEDDGIQKFDTTRALSPFFSSLMCCSMDVVRPFYLNKAFEKGSERHLQQVERRPDQTYKPLMAQEGGMTAVREADAEASVNRGKKGRHEQGPLGKRQAARLVTKVGQRVLGMEFLTTTPLTSPPQVRVDEPRRRLDVLDDIRPSDPTLYARPFTLTNHSDRKAADRIVNQAKHKKLLSSVRL